MRNKIGCTIQYLKWKLVVSNVHAVTRKTIKRKVLVSVRFVLFSQKKKYSSCKIRFGSIVINRRNRRVKIIAEVFD